jgi:hypothetical protein
MKRFKKLAMTVAALAALAVGGAAFAQAQNASTAASTPTHQAVGDGDGEHADGPDSAAKADGEHADGPDLATEADGEQADGPDSAAGGQE